MIDLLLSLAFRLALYLLALPVSLVLATPVILVRAGVSDRAFLQSVGGQYRDLVHFWRSTLSSFG